MSTTQRLIPVDSALVKARYFSSFERENLGASLWAHGAVSKDLNNDGFDDIFIAGGKADDVLYLNNRNGTFTNIYTKPKVSLKSPCFWLFCVSSVSLACCFC